MSARRTVILLLLYVAVTVSIAVLLDSAISYSHVLNHCNHSCDSTLLLVHSPLCMFCISQEDLHV
jgi:hypothetical protein